MRKLTIALIGMVIVLLAPLGATAAQIYTTGLTITAEDLIETEAGRKVKDLNEKMRSVGEASEKVEKGSHAYNLLKQEFDNLKRERDDVGKNLRGLRGKDLVFYGDRANADAYDFKRRFIDRWQQDSAIRDHFSGGPVHVSYNKDGQQRVATSPPRAEDVDSYVAEVDTSSQPSGPATTSSDTGTTVMPDSLPMMEDPCATILGGAPSDPACAGR